MLRKVSIMDEKWDYLIVLDACRYDYFSRFYGYYLQGKLEKVLSPASTTLGWCKKSFREYYDDVVYVSTNPYINSKVEVEGFGAKDYFFRVVDVWDYGWDEKFGTVHPQKVNEAVQNLRGKYSGKRFIIHYMQPHAPYLGYNLNIGFVRPQMMLARNTIRVKFRTDRKSKILEKAVEILRSRGRIPAFLTKQVGFLRGNLSWKVRELLNLPPATPLDAVRRRAGDIGLRQAYAENLRLVLTHVVKLVDIISGLIIVTADHGALLGEGGCYGHFGESTNRLLREIPWFTIDKKGNRSERTEG